MNVLTHITTFLGDLTFAALSLLGPLAALIVISALVGVAMLYIWRYTSNQAAIADVRNKIAANLLASRLFKDNLSVTFRAQRQIVWQALRLLAYSIRPMIIMTVPFVLVMVQIGLRYEFRPLPAGERFRVKAMLKSGIVSKDDDWKAIGNPLVLPEGLTADAHDPCRVRALRTMDWRITAAKPGNYKLTLRTGVVDADAGAGTSAGARSPVAGAKVPGARIPSRTDSADAVEMPLTIGDGFTRLSSLRGGGFFDRLLYSAEPSIPASSVFESIQIYYPPRATPIFGWNIHWLITLLVLSIVFALIFKPLVKVHI